MIKPNHKPKLQNRRFRTAIYFLSLLISVLVVWLLLCPESFSGGIDNVVLISVDTCRADYLGCYGYPGETTPNIDAVAREAVLFNHTLTPVPLTIPAHASKHGEIVNNKSIFTFYPALSAVFLSRLAVSTLVYSSGLRTEDNAIPSFRAVIIPTASR